jgi:hypothetical protein
MFENTKLTKLTADDIEMYLRLRLKQRVTAIETHFEQLFSNQWELWWARQDSNL